MVDEIYLYKHKRDFGTVLKLDYPESSEKSMADNENVSIVTFEVPADE